MMLKYAVAVLLVLPILFVTTECHTVCCEGWFPYDGHCYQAFYNKRSWGEGEVTCNSYGGHLAIVTTEAENTFVTSLLQSPSTSAWIGGHDIFKEGDWQWVDNSTPWDYTNWASPSYPRDSGSYNCLYLSSSGSWTDYQCCGIYTYVCEIPPVSHSQKLQEKSLSEQAQQMFVKDFLYSKLSLNAKSTQK